MTTRRVQSYLFSRSIYILPSNGSLEVELRASVAPETDLSIPVIIEGTAILDEDYEISANGFMIKSRRNKCHFNHYSQKQPDCQP